MKAAGFAVVAFGLIFLALGLCFGLTGVRAVSSGSGVACGSAFSAAYVVDDTFDETTDTSREQCDAARADVLHWALGLTVGGVVGIIVGSLGFAVGDHAERQTALRPARPEPSGAQ